MKKNKNKKKSGKNTLLSGAAKSLKKLSKGSGLNRLTTTQKILGGAALLAAGLSYLGKRRNSTPAMPPATDAAAAEKNLNALDGDGI